MTEKQTILAMYSGGLDSLYMVYKLLTSDEYSDKCVHIHHVHIHNVEDRFKAEALMVNAALTELKQRGFTFIYSESKISSPAFRNNNKVSYMYDWDIVRFYAGWIASANPDISAIAIGREQSDAGEFNQYDSAAALVKYFTDIPLIYPVMDMHKSEMYGKLPDWLKDKFWSCRTPIYQNNIPTKCGFCGTCKKLLKYNIGGS
jgi:7-cyano-7-deazaguanine synthase in queuosine biosynthesis